VRERSTLLEPPPPPPYLRVSDPFRRDFAGVCKQDLKFAKIREDWKKIRIRWKSFNAIPVFASSTR
jgi:hypothetical protein